MAAIDITGMEEAKVHVSKEITATQADMKRMESRCNKAGEDASKALAMITELSMQSPLLLEQYSY